MEDTPKADTHAHVWDETCQMVPGARYHPKYSAPIDTYLKLLDNHGIEQAVLVQPSFLGSDNDYLLNCLKAHPDRLRGIVVIEPGTTGDQLDDMTAAGVIGLRYNLLSLPPMWLGKPEFQILTSQADRRGWWIEVQADGPDWPFVLRILEDTALMIDHFGRPGDVPCAGFEEILARAPDRTCVKLSAPYRLPNLDLRLAARRLISNFGAERCVWGSDWPWTQHEAKHSYADCVQWWSDWTSEHDRRLANATNLLLRTKL